MKLIDDAMLFVDVVQAGSFTRAAATTYGSKSAISRRIAQLEQRLNAQLLIRLPRGLQLTPAGEQFYQSCLQIQQDFAAATAHLQHEQQQVHGRLFITAPLTLGSMIIGPLLAKFMRNYPDICVELDLSDHVRSVAEDRIDIALRAARQLPDSNLKARKLLSYGYHVCASPAYLQRHGTPTTPQQLSEHRTIACLTGSSDYRGDQWPFVYQGEETKVTIKPVACVTHMGVQKQMALEDQGIIRVPSYWVTDEIESGSLVSLLAPYNTITSNLFAVYKNLSTTPAKVVVLLDYLSEHLNF